MLRKYSSVDRIDKENRRKPLDPSPYSLHYKSNLTHDQRELISHRQHVKKLHRNDLEDRYLELLDENFAIKKENTSNHDKIRKLVTKVIRLSSDDKRTRPSSSDPTNTTKSKLSTDENLKIKIIDLESYNAQLRDRLNLVIRYVNSNKRSTSSATYRRTGSGLLKKSKMFKSQDEFIFNIPLSRPETQNSRMLCFEDENIKSAVAHYEDTITETDETSKLEMQKEVGKAEDVLNTLKVTIEQLQNDLSTEKLNNQRLVQIQTELEKTIQEQETNSKQYVDSNELDGMNERLRNYEIEIGQLQKDCLNIKSISENELEDERTKLFELKAILDKEMEKNKKLLKEKEFLEEKVESANQMKQESCDMQAENELLRKHRENISSLASELALRNETIKKLTKTNEELTSDVMDSKAQLQALNDIHHDLMNKIRDLQDLNDSLTIQVEGLKARCQCLMEQNTELNKKYHSVNLIIEV
ncbi:protein fantom-like [Bradysia coprophila]|uniref:protein fantom-like n=1 Tax=Bradysia coprophila TaxID=38358 RepID=UPI00187D74B3|nr:protein fantom-like [Bradysia coprophila]